MNKTSPESKVREASQPDYDCRGDTAEELLHYGTKPMKIVILYDLQAARWDGFADDNGEGFCHHELKSLRSLGHEVSAIGLSYENLDVIQTIEADFVLNLCDSTGPDDYPGVEVIIALERRVIPFSGVGSAPYHLSNDKLQIKNAFKAAKVPVPYGFVMVHPDQPVPESLRYPVFVKPRYGYGSLGVDANSRAVDEKGLREAVAHVVKVSGADAIVEEYIDGREITVGVIGSGSRNLVLPPLEVCFGDAYKGKPQVRMYDTKENTKSPLYWDFKTLCPAPMDPETYRRVEETALKAYQAIGADGYGRVDIRLGTDGVPYVLECNANPCIDDGPNEQDSGIFPLMCKALGWSYAESLARLIGIGLLRAVRKYRPPLLVLYANEKGLSTRSTIGVRKGALLSPVGPFNPAFPGCPESFKLTSLDGQSLLPEPLLRSMRHSDTPNVGLQYSRGKLHLVALRSIKSREDLTFNRHEPIALPGQESAPAAVPTRVTRNRRGARRY